MVHSDLKLHLSYPPPLSLCFNQWETSWFHQTNLRSCQGDPLSPYLFILASEGLTKLLRLGEQNSQIHGVQIAPKCPTISHLMFADNTILFPRATPAEITRLNSILKVYQTSSGKLLNKSKQVAFFPKASLTAKDLLISTPSNSNP